MLKMLFRLEKPGCKNSSRLVPYDSTKRSRGMLLPWRKARRSAHFISACYEQKTYPPDTMHWARYKVLVSLTGRKGPTAAQDTSETKVTATYYGSLLEIRETKAGSFSSLYLESCSATWSTRAGSTWVWLDIRRTTRCILPSVITK